MITLKELELLNVAHEACVGWLKNMLEQRTMDDRKKVEKMYIKAKDEYTNFYSSLKTREPGC